jgi:DNA repair exonuclease SbcCD nuclease subunit
MSLKSLVLGDCHFCDRVPLRRSDDFLQAQFNKLVALEKLIISEKDIDGLFLLGDVFDIPKPSLELVNRVMDHLDRINKLLPLGIYAIVGNHDVHGRVESVQETALGTLYASRLVKQLAGKQIIKGIPFLGIDYLVNHTPEIYKGNNQIILTHNMLIPAPAIFKHILAKDISPLVSNTTIFAGHYHSPFNVTLLNNSSVINPGVLVRTDIAERKIVPSAVKFEASMYPDLHVNWTRIPLEKDNGETVFNLLDYKEEKTQKLDLEKFINGLKQSQFESQDLEKLIQEVGTLSKVDEKVIQEALERIKSARMVVK